jgi:hypothetical protein
MALGDEIDEIFRREVKSLPAYAKAQAAAGSGVAPPVDEMNHLLMAWSSPRSVRCTCSPKGSRTWKTYNQGRRKRRGRLATLPSTRQAGEAEPRCQAMAKQTLLRPYGP